MIRLKEEMLYKNLSQDTNTNKRKNFMYTIGVDEVEYEGLLSITILTMCTSKLFAPSILFCFLFISPVISTKHMNDNKKFIQQ